MGDKIRCFIAIDLPIEAIEELGRVQKELEKKNIFNGKFTKSENLHLTLKFLGEIDEESVDEVGKRLEEINFNGFEVVLGKLGFFSKERIRIVWVELLGKGVFEMQKEIDDKFSDLFGREQRFMSHLTLARVKSVEDRKLFLDNLKKIKIKKLKFGIKWFYLMKSELKPEGPVYSVLEKFSLA